MANIALVWFLFFYAIFAFGMRTLEKKLHAGELTAVKTNNRKMFILVAAMLFVAIGIVLLRPTAMWLLIVMFGLLVVICRNIQIRCNTYIPSIYINGYTRLSISYVIAICGYGTILGYDVGYAL